MLLFEQNNVLAIFEKTLYFLLYNYTGCLVDNDEMFCYISII